MDETRVLGMDGIRALDRAGIVDRLAANAAVFRGLLADVDDEQARWKPTPDEWSLLEVVCHLADEERDDFRRRLDLTLHEPGLPWPAIDPEGRAVEGEYNQRDLGGSLEDFLSERGESVRWLRGLIGADGSAASAEVLESPREPAPDWSSTYDHPKMGPITAGDLLTSWLAHDLIHIRQLNRLHRQYLVAVLSSGSPDYAGEW